MTERSALPPSQLPDVGSYHDLRSLNQLRQLGKQDERAALTAAAKQFESVFLQELLKSMRAANEVFEDDDFFGGGNSEFYEQMHDEQLALSLANQQTMGLAEIMVQQLSRSPDRKSSTGNAGDAASLPFAALISTERTAPLSSVNTAPRASADALPPRMPVTAMASATAVTPPLQAAENRAPVTPLSFVTEVLPHAEQAAKTLGVDPALLVAQAALETGWGRAASGNPAAVGGKDLPVSSTAGQHYFGIKADGRWQGPVVNTNTLEYVGGVPQRQRASFRAYPSAAEAFTDYAQFIQSSPRYAEALQQAGDPRQYAEALQRGGYATDPAYANKLMRVFDSTMLRDLIAEARKLL